MSGPSSSRARPVRILRRLFAVVAILAVAFAVPSGPARAETGQRAVLGGAAALARLATALDVERRALANLSRSPGFPELSGLPTAPDGALGETGTGDAARTARRRLIELETEDALVAAAIDGAQDRAAAALFGADSGGAMAFDKIESITVGAPTEAWSCLAEAIYFEARGESLIGQFAVAEVVLNRVDSPRFPDTVCAVVGQGSESGGACQFSYKCDGLSDRPADRRAYELSGKIAWAMLQGKPRILTGKATYYHATWVNPHWAGSFTQTARIGDHLFYRRDTRLSQR